MRTCMSGSGHKMHLQMSNPNNDMTSLGHCSIHHPLPPLHLMVLMVLVNQDLESSDTASRLTSSFHGLPSLQTVPTRLASHKHHTLVMTSHTGSQPHLLVLEIVFAISEVAIIKLSPSSGVEIMSDSPQFELKRIVLTMPT